jgi:hypothetical protein
MTYHAVGNYLPLAQEHGDGHVARLREFPERGVLISASPLWDPVNGDAIGVFRTRAGAREFVAGDPSYSTA